MLRLAQQACSIYYVARRTSAAVAATKAVQVEQSPWDLGEGMTRERPTSRGSKAL
jgi:hypothetical protein